MTRKVGLLLLLAIAFQSIYAQHKLHGIIRNDAGTEAIAGVSVFLTEVKTLVYSDSNGRFEFNNLKAGRYLLEISHPGTHTRVLNLVMPADSFIVLNLMPAHRELSDVVVTGVSRSMESKRSPYSISFLDRNALQQQSSSNLVDAMRQVPGVNALSTGNSVAKPLIRGLGYSRVISLHNGMRQEGQQWGDEHGLEIDEYSVDRIEIVKGPGSLLYGSDGIAGVIHFLSPKAPPPGSVQTRLLTQYQHNSPLLSASLSNSGNRNGFQWMGRMSSKYAGNYKNAYDGPVYNSGSREWNASAFLGLNRSRGHSHLNVSTYNTILNLPEGERDQEGYFIRTDSTGQPHRVSSDELRGFKTGIPYQKVNHMQLSSSNYLILGKGSLHVDAGYQQNRRREFGNPAQMDEAGLYMILHTFQYHARYQRSLPNNWEWTLGLGGMQQYHNNAANEVVIPGYRISDQGLFSLLQKEYDSRFTIAGGLRIDRRDLLTRDLWTDSSGQTLDQFQPGAIQKFSSLERQFMGWSGSLGFSWQLNSRNTLKLNFSRGYRAPNLYELSANGKHEGTFRYEYGDKDLRNEYSHQADISYLLNGDHISLEISPFVNAVDHFIYSSKLQNASGMDSIPDPADPAPAFRFRSGNAVLTGGECYLDLHPHPLDWLHLEQSFSYVQGILLHAADSMRNLPMIPAAKYRAEVKAEFAPVHTVISKYFVKVGAEYYFRKDRVFEAYGTETPVPAYMLWNAAMDLHLKRGSGRLQVYLNADNIGNKAYQSHTSRLRYAPDNPATGRRGIYNMGRNIGLKTVLQF